jgi:rod shape determining protein RodA
MTEIRRAQRFLRVDWTIVGITVLLGGIGIGSLYSAAAPGFPASTPPIYVKQAIFFGLGLVLAALVALVDYRRWLEYAWILYVLGVAMLAGVLVFGKVTSGSQRWFSLGAVSFQPSELFKWIMMMAIVRFFQTHPSATGYYTIREALPVLGGIALPAALIALQPDLGTTILLLMTSVSMLLLGGLRMRSFLKIVAVGLAGLPLIWRMLEGYQRGRILTFLDPQRDPLGAGYHVTQSKIAVGSGGLLGKGFLQGTQSQLRFLPEHHTDFAFSVWAEEWGFVGCLVLLSLFLLLLLYGLHVANRAGDAAGRLLAFGVVAHFFWPVVINVGMTVGLVPVVGVTLPFISYGGSSLITSLMAMGLLVNVHMRRFIF